MKRFLLASLALCFVCVAMAQTGTIRGTVMDGASGLTMIGCNVYLDGTDYGSSTDFDGKYAIVNVPEGTYTLTLAFVSYKTITEQIVVKGDDVIVKDYTMVEDYIDLGEAAEIVAKQNTRNVYAMDNMKKKAASMVDGIGAAQIKKNSDASVATAAKRVTGVSVEGGKYIYVRGLSDRYSKTLVNGAEVPGLDPNRNSVQLDLFPTALINNMTVNKTFTPDLPASFTGGLINIETRDFPDSLIQTASASLGYNVNASFNSNFLTYAGGSRDFLGFDDGTRALPTEIGGEVEEFTTGDRTALTAQSRSFNNQWNNTTKSPFLNQSFSYSVGNQINLNDKGRAFGFVGSLTYRKTQQFYEGGQQGRFKLTSAESTSLNVEKRMTDSRGDENVLWGALLNTSLRFNPSNKVSLTLLRNQNGISSSRYLSGRVANDPDWIKEERSLRYQQRSMSTAQLQGEHILDSDRMSKVTWVASTVFSSQETPDLRVFQNHHQVNSQGEPFLYSINQSEYLAPTRFFRDMNERNFDVKVHYERPFGFGKDSLESKFKSGVAMVSKKRDFTEQRFVFESNGISYDGDLDNFYNDANLDATQEDFIYVSDQSELRNNYTATEDVMAGYAMFDLKVTPLFRAIIGARAEQANIEAVSDRFFVETEDEVKAKFIGTLDKLDILPSINTSYALNEKSNLRAAYTQTVARPSFREISPFASFDFEFQLVKIGNPELERTLVHNIDLRYELFPNLGELVSFSAYYKRFSNPIEVVTNPEAANTELTWSNQDFANLYGIEFEARKKLSFISEKLEKFQVGVNASYIQSQTQINAAELEQIRATDPDHKETRQMFGQSPYLVNAYLNWSNPDKGLESLVSFNVNGPKLVVVTDGGTPDVYDTPRPQLDWMISKSINNLKLKARVSNILNAQTRWVQNYNNIDYVFQSFDRGQTVTLSASLAF